ncbi:MAG: nuclear transport factor 2 family protein [Pseudobacteriovorax sp.]|nr:nuclear transport factor 2 family protein [Pseudobacteriovorax sp.]
MKYTLLTTLILFLSTTNLRADQRQVERQMIIDTVNQLFIKTDQKDWKAVSALFSDKVKFDMTSLAGGKPQTLSGKVIANQWKAGLSKVDSIHHQVGNYVVTMKKDKASVFANGIATHFTKNSDKPLTWFVGTYDLDLQKKEGTWRIVGFKFNSKFVH